MVDSTKLSEALGDAAMAEVWAAHDRVARDLLPRFGGREIDKTDGMLLLFDTAAQAVDYAQCYHQALAGMAVPLRARAGLHVGPVILRENPADDVARGAKPLEVDGLAKPTAARVMSIARGGQTLLTSEAREDLGKTLLKLQSHGHWLVKGVADPIELFEVGEAETRFIAPPDSDKVFRVVRSGDWWMPVKDIANNLPHQGTSFIGRERELEDVKTMLGETRLVTLLGMGGLGKTRLSLQAAAEVMAQYPDGVWFLDLASLSDPALVVPEAARTLGVPEEPGRPPLQALCAHLKAKRVLLILDNCEHLIKPSADLAHALIKACPQVRLLSSSREPLHVPGEHTYPILPLPVPGRDDGLEALSRSTAVRLFVERARGHKPAFELNEREAPAVAELVARLEGIPLALELAAARVRSLSVADINKRLDDRYKILTGGSRVLQERQQTLRALVDWSYELLSETEQLLLKRLAVFVGGFDLEAAEKVCGFDPVEDFEVLDLLSSLVDKSLIMHDERDASSRYRMLETIRDYARQKLGDSGETPLMAERHCEHFFQVAKLVRQGVEGAEQAECLRRMETELDNVRSAMALALSGAVDPVLSVKFAVAMQAFWVLRNYGTEGRRLVKAALALPEVEASELAKAHALSAGAELAASQGDYQEARSMLETCLELRRGLGDPVAVAASLSDLSFARLQAGDAATAQANTVEALALFRQQNDRWGEAIGLLRMGQIAIYEADHPRARDWLAQGLTIARELEHQEVEGECELLLGEVALNTGDGDTARVHFERSLAVCRESADKRGQASASWRLGETDLQSGNATAARERLSEALRTFRAADMWKEMLGCLEGHARLALLEGEPKTAVRISAAVTVARKRLDLAHAPLSEEQWQAQLSKLRESLADEEFAAAWTEASVQWEADDAIRFALAPRPRSLESEAQ